jgi:hypothetical protein
VLRGLILLIIVFGLVLLASPFVISSLYVDQRGIALPGRVFSKSETITVPYSGWKRSAEVTIEYHPADESSVGYFNARLDPEEYDAFHKGEMVGLHYLRRQDIPTVPLSKLLLEVHALPRVRLANQRTFSGLERLFTRKVITLCGAVAAVAILLFVARMARWRLFWWAVGICVFLSVTALLISEFPTPMPRPTVQIRQGSGRVKSVERIDRLFRGSRQRGLIADQPVQVVGIEFVPAGRTEPVVAVDLIDAGSIPGLAENSTVAIEYEGDSPRTAYIQAGTRGFVGRNLTGIAVQGILCLLVLIGFLAAAHFIGRAWNRLIGKR